MTQKPQYSRTRLSHSCLIERVLTKGTVLMLAGVELTILEDTTVACDEVNWAWLQDKVGLKLADVCVR